MTSYPNAGQPWQQQQQQEGQAYLSLNPMASPVFSKYNAVIDENQIVMDYNPPGNIPPPIFENQRNNTDGSSAIPNKKVQWVYNPLDGSVLKDHNGAPLSVDRLLATNPLKHELSTRPGPGNKKLTYISGDDVSRTLNDVFGFDGWDLDIKDVSRVDASKDPKTGKHTIVYTARVRLTHKASGTYKEDCGAGDSTDRVYGTAIAHALKASITDAMKRAARHFGDKLGNSLYSGNFNINKAPVSLKDALDKYDIHRCNTKFGFNKQNANSSAPKTATAPTTSVSTSYNPPPSSMPPPTRAGPAKAQQVDPTNPRGTSMHSNTATNSSVPQQRRQSYPQHQHSHQPQSIRQQQGTTNPSANSEASNLHRQNPQRNLDSTKSNAPNFSGPTIISRQHHLQNMSSATSIAQQLKNASNAGSKVSAIPPSDVPRPSTSYGRRPALGSNTRGHTASQPPPAHANGGNNTAQTNSNNKRPPLGAISHYPTTGGYSSELSSKRQKQQGHHNPYTGRKSI